MSNYLWEFSFHDLWEAEPKKPIWKDLTNEERQMVEDLEHYFEQTAKKGREAIFSMDSDRFATSLPSLMNIDITLQLCLIFALTVQECFLSNNQLLTQIKSEVETYFYEYRRFGQRYQFEQYSILNQIEIVMI